MYHPELPHDPDRVPEELNALREALAEQVHDTWAAGRLADGWTYGPELDAARRTHPCLIPYGELPEREKAYDRRTAAATIRCILEHGYRIVQDGTAVNLTTQTHE